MLSLRILAKDSSDLILKIRELSKEVEKMNMDCDNTKSLVGLSKFGTKIKEG